MSKSFVGELTAWTLYGIVPSREGIILHAAAYLPVKSHRPRKDRLPVMTRKIALCGAHGTGKTTLLSELERALRNGGTVCSVVPEVPRIVCATADDPQFFRRGRNSLERQLSLLLGQPVLETVQGRSATYTLCDRTILDHWAYTRFLFKDRLLATGLLNVIEHFVTLHCATYDALFYLPVEFPPRDDGTREGDAEFQEAIDREIRSLLDTFELKYTTVRGSIAERARLVLQSTEAVGLLKTGGSA